MRKPIPLPASLPLSCLEGRAKTWGFSLRNPGLFFSQKRCFVAPTRKSTCLVAGLRHPWTPLPEPADPTAGSAATPGQTLAGRQSHMPRGGRAGAVTRGNGNPAGRLCRGGAWTLEAGETRGTEIPHVRPFALQQWGVAALASNRTGCSPHICPRFGGGLSYQKVVTSSRTKGRR